MSTTNTDLADLKEVLEFHCEGETDNLSDEQLIQFAADHINSLEIENSLYSLAIESNLTGPAFERWFEMAVSKLNNLKEGEQLVDEDLIALMKEARD